MQYSLGWAVGMMLVPALHAFTPNYRHLFLISLVMQLFMLLWLSMGVFESVRWLLSEGKVNRAQMELQRACKMNKRADGAQLARQIARVQMQMLRDASRVIELEQTPAKLARVVGRGPDEVARELLQLRTGLRQSFGIESQIKSGRASPIKRSRKRQPSEAHDKKPHTCRTLSPTLARIMHTGCLRRSCDARCSQANMAANLPTQQQQQQRAASIADSKTMMSAQTIAHMTLACAKTLQQAEEGSCFIVSLFHAKLYKLTLTMMLVSVTIEAAYFGLLQATRFVGSSVSLNYISGALVELLATSIFGLLIWTLSRRMAIVVPTLCTGLICACMALTYQLLPDTDELKSVEFVAHDVANLLMQPMVKASQANATMLARTGIEDAPVDDIQTDWSHLRHSINFWLMNAGKLSATVAIQIVATISMEVYPNNLRQTGSGLIVLVGRVASIWAPFLFVDHTLAGRVVLQCTLCLLACLAGLSCAALSRYMHDYKHRDLCNKLTDIV